MKIPCVQLVVVLSGISLIVFVIWSTAVLVLKANRIYASFIVFFWFGFACFCNAAIRDIDTGFDG